MRKAGFICSRTLLFTGWYNKSCYNTVIGRPGYIKTLEKARNTQPVDALPRNTAQNKSDALILSIIPTTAPVKAPMPGVVLKVQVQQGQAVKAGQVLVILEAMKMENEIVAPKDGTVAQIVAAKGASVESGAPLVILA